MISKELLLEQLKTFRVEKVTKLPDGIEPLFVRSCSEADIEWVLKDVGSVRSRMFCVSVCDQDGMLLFGRNDLTKVRDFTFEILDAAWMVAAKLNKIAEEGAAEKN